MIIESKSNQSLVDFFRKEFFDPIGMKDTFLASIEDVLKYRSGELNDVYPTRYFVTQKGGKPKFTIATSNTKSNFVFVPYADGGVASNAADLIKWNEALHGGRILSEASYNLMTTKYVPSHDQGGLKTHHGYGLFISELPDGQILYHHGGSIIATRMESGYVPESKFSYSIFSNIAAPMLDDGTQSKIDLTLPINQIDITYFRNALLQKIEKGN
jgi:CubicO group peptidase (beta-lactamase class C family)